MIQRGETFVLSSAEIEICQQSKRIVRAFGSRLVADDAAQESFGCGGIVEGGGEGAADQRRRLGIRRAAQFKPPMVLREWPERVLPGLGSDDRNAGQSHDPGDDGFVKHHSPPSGRR